MQLALVAEAERSKVSTNDPHFRTATLNRKEAPMAGYGGGSKALPLWPQRAAQPFRPTGRAAPTGSATPLPPRALLAARHFKDLNHD